MCVLYRTHFDNRGIHDEVFDMGNLRAEFCDSKHQYYSAIWTYGMGAMFLHLSITCLLISEKGISHTGVRLSHSDRDKPRVNAPGHPTEILNPERIQSYYGPQCLVQWKSSI
jgi:hypothetical protein